jgi:hypothetical protein
MRNRHGNRKTAMQGECPPAARSGIAREEKRESEPALTQRQRRSVVRAFDILKAFRYPGERVRGCDLSRRTMIPEATVNSLMSTLELVGAVIRDDRGQYQCALLSMAGFNDAIFNNTNPLAATPPRDAAAHYSGRP